MRNDLSMKLDHNSVFYHSCHFICIDSFNMFYNNHRRPVLLLLYKMEEVLISLLFYRRIKVIQSLNKTGSIEI